ncbi:MAG TPA: lamin tail domain-containing protein [Candidatus Dormibacteraeota bacterium]|nr:lamin tail domain-containing protein [Candidatus Dormibacteraeota bacterium]
MTVDFTQFTGDGANGSGALIYATTAETSGNRLIAIPDLGPGSAATALETAGPNQLLRGVRFGPTAAPVLMVNALQSQTKDLGATAVFSANVSGSQPISYQWRFNGTNIAGATLASLSVSNISPTNAGTYSVFVANDISSTNAAAVLTVLVNSNAPILLGAQSLGLSAVQVMFSAQITVDTATNPANYTLSGPSGAVPIMGAVQTLSASNVVLTVATMNNGSLYTLTASNLANAFASGNVLPPNSHTNFIATSYVPIGLGISPPQQTTLSNGFLISAAGSLFNGANDQAGFSCQQQVGDFDVSVCLAGLGAVDVWTEAGLMARQSLDVGSPFAASIATPSMSGCFFESRSVTNGGTTQAGSFPPNFPNTWLRLSRTGSLFTGYASYDGQVWTPLGSQTIAMSDPVYIGLALTSNDPNTPAAAQFINVSNTPPGALTGPNTNPHEPLGPCSRLTGIVISEMMYKPAPRADTNNCEYVEIYNSQPFFHDVSGYQLTCADMSYTFPPNTMIPAGGFLVVAASPSSIRSVYGITNVLGPYTGSLKKSETLQLLDEQGSVLLTVPYSATYPWPVAADGTGHSLVLANPTYGEGDPRAWDTSDIIGGSPGLMESYRPSPLRNVLINEFLAHSENVNVPEFVELYNHSTGTVDISGCILTDNPANHAFIIPPATLLGPGGFVSFNQAQLGFLLNGAGDTIYFLKPDATRILDAVQFEPQADGVSFGRWPDGANDFYPFTSTTPGTNNSSIAIGTIVINELMYNPITGNDDDQYLELYNASSNPVSLANWQFTAGVTFTFPSTAVIPPNGYAVVGRNMANLFAHYPNLTSANTFGNFTGKLSHNGERVALARPVVFFGSTTNYLVEDEVTYGTGGRWGRWSSGGGSSLELLDPHSNHRLPSNWADSDETQKSQWVTISNTGVLDNGTNYNNAPITYAQVGLLDVGECLVDNVTVLYQGTNFCTNSTFETGLAGWNFQGDHVRSSLEPTGYQSSQSVHVRASDRFWHAENSCEISLAANTMAGGATATLQFQARWLRGWPEPILRLGGNWLEATGAMPVPANLGTPGLPNSASVANAGPAIYQVTHTPSLPAANQPAVVTARVHAPNGVTNVTLFYRIDPATTYTSIPMLDNGAGGDAIAGDGLFSATIPGQPANTLAAFYVSATDGLGASTRFPALRPANNEPVRECVVLFGDGSPVSSLGTYHLWVTQTNIQRWINLADLGNEYIDCTFVTQNRVIYSAGGRFTTSPAHQGFNSPVGKLCGYEWEFPDDDKVLGTTSFHKIHLPGNGGLTDSTLQREAMSYTFLRALGEPWLYRRDVGVFVNGNRRGPLMEDVQVPNGDYVKEYFPNDSGGYLYKFNQWYEFAAQPSGVSIGYSKVSTHTLLPYTTTGGVKKVARYRLMYQIHRTPGSMNDFTNVFNLVDAASSFGTSNYVANMEGLADMQNWMDVFAVNHAVGNWDVYGGETGQNLYGYQGTVGTKMTLLMWDMNIDLGSGGSWGAGANLFTSNVNDTNTENIFICPAFRRMYWNALQRLINGPFSVAAITPLAEAKYKAFANANLGQYLSGGLDDPSGALSSWIAQAQSSIASQIAAIDAPQFSVNASAPVTNNVVYVSGTAPVAISTVWINGVAWPVTWTTLTTWLVTIPTHPGTNELSVVGVDVHGQPVSGANGTAVAVAPNAPILLDAVLYTNANSVYNQNFDSLPNPGATTVNSDNPVTINGNTYSPTNPLDFATPIPPGGLGLSSTMLGWYGSAGASMKLGASAGDQSTGGIISFGPTNSAATNRALGLLATSSTGPTAFGLAILNQTAQTLNQLTLGFTGEIWRQQPAAKTLSFSYYLDPTGTNTFSTNGTIALAALNVSFPTGAFSPRDGTQSSNQISLSVTNQLIANWNPGAALWLVWQMTNSAGNAQGLAIDNFRFSASSSIRPTLSITRSNANVILTWPTNIPGYSLQSTPALGNSWQTLAITNPANTIIVPITNSSQFFRLIH